MNLGSLALGIGGFSSRGLKIDSKFQRFLGMGGLGTSEGCRLIRISIRDAGRGPKADPHCLILHGGLRNFN